MPTDFMQFLAFIASPTFGAWVVSEWLENQPFFISQDDHRKSNITLLVYVSLAILSYVLVRWVPAAAVQELQPVFAIVIGTVVAFSSGELYHSKTKTTIDVTAKSYTSSTGSGEPQKSVEVLATTKGTQGDVSKALDVIDTTVPPAA